jgi:hypothetical protein
MKPNIGKVERVVRVVAGIRVLSLASWDPTPPRRLGHPALLSGLIGWCPLHRQHLDCQDVEVGAPTGRGHGSYAEGTTAQPGWRWQDCPGHGD